MSHVLYRTRPLCSVRCVLKHCLFTVHEWSPTQKHATASERCSALFERNYAVRIWGKFRQAGFVGAGLVGEHGVFAGGTGGAVRVWKTGRVLVQTDWQVQIFLNKEKKKTDMFQSKKNLISRIHLSWKEGWGNHSLQTRWAVKHPFKTTLCKHAFLCFACLSANPPICLMCSCSPVGKKIKPVGINHVGNMFPLFSFLSPLFSSPLDCLMGL